MSENAKQLQEELLGIRDDPNSLDYYALLKLRRFETNLDRIHQAALRQMKKLREWQLHPDPETAKIVHDLLNLLSRACTTLEVPDRKEDYDNELRNQRIVDEEIKEEPNISVATSGKVSLNLAQLEESKKRREEKERRNREAMERRKARTKAFAQLKADRGNKQSALKLNLKHCPICHARSSKLAVTCIECGFDFEEFETSKKTPKSNSLVFTVTLIDGALERIFNILKLTAVVSLSGLARIVRVVLIIFTIVFYAGLMLGIYYYCLRTNNESVNIMRMFFLVAANFVIWLVYSCSRHFSVK